MRVVVEKAAVEAVSSSLTSAALALGCMAGLLSRRGEYPPSVRDVCDDVSRRWSNGVSQLGQDWFDAGRTLAGAVARFEDADRAAMGAGS